MRKKIIVATVSYMVLFSGGAQVLGNLVRDFQNHKSNFPQEKIFVHTDRHRYFAGDDIWFKAYLVNAADFEAAVPSGALRVELIGPDNTLVDQRLLKVEGFGSEGDFSLGDSIPSGIYRLRAYTNWMRNFDQEFFFSSEFDVLGESPEIKEKVDNSSLRVEFFPESGDIIEGVSSLVAFKCTDFSGNSVQLEGYVVDSEGKKLNDFSTFHAGIGVIYLPSENSGPLYAEIVWQDSTMRFQLPAAQNRGCSMRVTNSFNSEQVIIAVQGQGVELNKGFIIGHQSGKIFALSENNSQGSAFAVAVDRSAFPPGICHLTFFDKDGVPWAERLVFANYPEMIDLDIRPLGEYGVREKASLEIIASGDSLTANLSVSITPQAAAVDGEDPSNIISYLMLTSDLKGYIENPNYYFSQTRDAFKALDYLMMTHGWRRFKWEDITNSVDSAQYWPEKGVTISGQLVDFYNYAKAREGKISLSVLSENFSLIESRTNEQGEFLFNDLAFYDSTNLLLQAKRLINEKKEKYLDDVFIKLDEWKIPPISELVGKAYQDILYDSASTKLNESIKKIDRAFNFDPDAIMLQDVTVLGRRRKTANERMTSANVLYGFPSNRIVADSVVGSEAFASAFDLIARIPGVRVGGNFPNQSVLIRGSTSISSSVTPLYLLDGSPVDEQTISTVSARDVSFIDVLKGSDAAIYGSRGAGGVVAVYTRIGSNQTSSIARGVLNITHPGYNKAREFYVPDYSIPIEEHAKPDFRSTLFWSPNVDLNVEGKALLEFFTSDQLGTFDVIVQGISGDGIPIFKKGSVHFTE